jgi:hypothetical protein
MMPRTQAGTQASRKRTRRRQPKALYEYVLLITPRYNETKKRIVTYVAIRTVKEFSNFRYRLIADARVENRTLRIDIRGLEAPELTLPDVGPAAFQTEFDNLNGTYDVIVQKLHKEENTFRVNISSQKVTVENVPEKRFVDIITHPEQW